MDFIPRVSTPARSPLQVSYLVRPGDGYNGLDFLDFPRQRGFDLKKISRGDFGGKTWEEVASFVQSWAYFGMLAELFRLSDLPLSSFISELGGPESLSLLSSLIPWFLRLWYHKEQQSTDADKEMNGKKAKAVLNAVREFVTDILGYEHFDVCDRPSDGSEPDFHQLDLHVRTRYVLKLSDNGYFERNQNFFSNETNVSKNPHERLRSTGHVLVLSIVTLGEYLDDALGLIYHTRLGSDRWLQPALHALLLEDAGWCHALINSWNGQFNNRRLLYLSQIDRKAAARKHGECRDTTCQVDEVDESSYVLEHLCKNADCQEITFEDAAVLETHRNWIELAAPILIKGNRGEGSDTYTWETVPGKRADGSRVAYVAISHVWSDGRGNPHRNALPECQLRYIQEAVNDLYNQKDRSVEFWIDTMCVPINRPLRQAVIAQMHDIYHGADKVLVLDNSLEFASLSATAEENMTRIELSGWMRRLWTLMEGVLGRDLHFRFSEGSTTLEVLRDLHRCQSMARFDADILNFAAHEPKAFADALANEALKEEIFGTESPCVDDYQSLEPIYASTSSVTGQIRGLSYGYDSSIKDKVGTKMMSLLMYQFQFRKTSKPSDESLILAAVLHVDVAKVQLLPPSERMKQIFADLGKASVGLLFGDLPRHLQFGGSWIPKTLLGRETIFSTREGVVVDNGGIMFRSPGLTLPLADELRVSTPFKIVNGSTGAQAIVRLYGIQSDQVLTIKSAGAIILADEWNWTKAIDGALVFVITVRNDCIVTGYRSSAFIEPIPQSLSAMSALLWDQERDFIVNHVDNEQKWYIA